MVSVWTYVVTNCCPLIIFPHTKNTYVPSAPKKNVELLLLSRFVRPTLTASGIDFLRIACNRLCGAISIVKAFRGSNVEASSNRTELSKLLVWYWADEYWASIVSHLTLGTLELNHFDERFLGLKITSFNLPRSRGPISAMYLL